MTQESSSGPFIRIRLPQISRETLLGKLGRNAEIWIWKTGLGKILNSYPAGFGKRLVLQFAANGRQLPLPYVETAGALYALVSTEEEMQDIQVLIADSAVQIWMSTGWFSGNARILPDQEQNEILYTFPPEAFLGSWNSQRRASAADRSLLVAIRRTAPCTGENGPGQYSWVWAVTTLFFFFSWLKKSFRTKK